MGCVRKGSNRGMLLEHNSSEGMKLFADDAAPGRALRLQRQEMHLSDQSQVPAKLLT